MRRMARATLYLPEAPDALQRSSPGVNAPRGAPLIGERITRLVREELPRPTPLYSSGDPTFAERVDEELAGGFGQR